jgi:outer membrane protein OmpA-like peptidoglycan-associated protein
LLVDSTINSKDSLNFVYDLLMEYPGMVLELSSHTDARGKDAANQLLSENRAKECVRYLVQEKGIDANRLKPLGKGESTPALWKDSETGEMISLTETYINQFKDKDKVKFEKLHQLNRRTEAKVLSLDYIPGAVAPSSSEVKPSVAPKK